MHRSTLIKALPPSFLFTYNLSTLLFSCNPQYIIIVFLFTSFPLDCSCPISEYCYCPCVYRRYLFLPFSLDFKINLCLRLYSLDIFSFISVSLILSNSIIPKYLNMCTFPVQPASSLHHLAALSLHFLRFLRLLLLLL